MIILTKSLFTWKTVSILARVTLTTLAVVLGLAHVWWLYGLRRQQGPWLTDVIEQVYGSSSQQLESFSGKAHLDIPEDGAEPR